MKNIFLYTDGSCTPNPGTGGYGAILIYNGVRKELSGGFRNTTNNRMEMMAALIGLEALRESCNVILISDSKYLVEPFVKGWIFEWKKKSYKKVKNADLWQRLLIQFNYHNVQFNWIKGHSLNPENDRCDKIAKQASKMDNLPFDLE